MSSQKNDRKLRSQAGRYIPVFDASGRLGASGFAKAIAHALRTEFGSSGSAVKHIVNLTSANERAVKNWLQGRNGPSGESLILLCRHSDQVLETMLILSGRPKHLAAKKIGDAKIKLREILIVLNELEA